MPLSSSFLVPAQRRGSERPAPEKEEINTFSTAQ